MTQVDFAAELQLTRMPQRDVANLLRKAGGKLIEVTAPDGSDVYLSAAAITTVRDSDPHLDPSSAKAVISVAGHRQAVRQTQQQVTDLLAAGA